MNSSVDCIILLMNFLSSETVKVYSPGSLSKLLLSKLTLSKYSNSIVASVTFTSRNSTTLLSFNLYLV